ncbi:MAG: RDD family protein [Candidatus Eremiobacteraeota bacterium]|nr:RDD family protein [Candidatus Eremiobacteraeota bacterium]MBV9645962.1 RDD family protein [Candidatus Eremiobacteraeota bacterium]
MERFSEVATGESVAFSYELAGLGSRFLAVFLDTLFQWCIALGIVIMSATMIPWLSGSVSFHARSTIVTSILLAALIIAAFFLFFGYFIAFETLWNGHTPGKRIVGIRVVRDGGFPVDFASAAIRNVVRIVEVVLGFYAISAVSALLSSQNKRLGDFAAGTIVVRDEAPVSATPLAHFVRNGARDDPLVRELGARERDLVIRYAGRRDQLGQRARVALAGQIAGIVRPQLAARFEHLDDDALLVHVAEALR